MEDPVKMTFIMTPTATDGMDGADPWFVETHLLGFPIYMNIWGEWKGETADPEEIKESMEALSDWFDFSKPDKVSGDTKIYEYEIGGEGGKQIVEIKY